MTSYQDQVRRRKILAGIGGLIGIGGGSMWVLSNDESNDEGDGGENTTTEQQDTEADTAPETDETESESQSENESDTGTETEAEPSSDPDSTEDSTRPEAVSVDDAVTAEIEYDVQEGTGVAVWGTVTNDTSDPIDQVAVTVRFYDSDDEMYHEMVDGTTGLAGWSEWEFELVSREPEYAERYARHEVDVTAQQLE